MQTGTEKAWKMSSKCKLISYNISNFHLPYPLFSYENITLEKSKNKIVENNETIR